jgi:hypothetical protein
LKTTFVILLSVHCVKHSQREKREVKFFFHCLNKVKNGKKVKSEKLKVKSEK